MSRITGTIQNVSLGLDGNVTLTMLYEKIVSLGLDFNATLTMHSKNIGLIGQQVDAMSIVLDGAINGQANNSATLSTKLQAIESHLVEDRIIGTSLAVVAIVLTLAGFIHLRGRGRERGVENEHELGRGVGR